MFRTDVYSLLSNCMSVGNTILLCVHLWSSVVPKSLSGNLNWLTTHEFTVLSLTVGVVCLWPVLLEVLLENQYYWIFSQSCPFRLPCMLRVFSFRFCSQTPWQSTGIRNRNSTRVLLRVLCFLGMVMLLVLILAPLPLVSLCVKNAVFQLVGFESYYVLVLFLFL